MAVRRKLGRFADMMLQSYLISKRQKELAGYESEMSSQRAGEQAQLQSTLRVLEGIMRDPLKAKMLKQSGVNQIGGVPIDLFLPQQADVIGGVGKQIAGMTSEGGMTQADIEALTTAGMGEPTRDPTVLEPLTRQLGSKVGALREAETPQEISFYNPLSKRDEKRFARPRELAGETFAMGPTPMEKGQGAGVAALTELQTPGLAGTRMSQAAGIAGAEAGARKRGELSPDIIAQEVERASQLAKAEAEYGTPTDSQARAQGFLPPLVLSDVGAVKLEQGGVQLNPFTKSLGNTPWLAGMIPEEQQTYLQHAQNFLNLASLVLTGVTARPDEYERYSATFFSVKGDLPPTVAQKQAARKAFISAVEARARRRLSYQSLSDVMKELGIGEESKPPSALDRLRSGR